MRTTKKKESRNYKQKHTNVNNKLVELTIWAQWGVASHPLMAKREGAETTPKGKNKIKQLGFGPTM